MPKLARALPWTFPSCTTRRIRHHRRENISGHRFGTLPFAYERLEERLVLAVSFVDLAIPNTSVDQLRFSGTFDLDSQGYYEATNSVEVGYKPVTGEGFKPLFTIRDGTVDLPGPNTDDQTKFSFFGAIELVTASGSPEVFKSPDNSQFTQIKISDLASDGVDFGADALKSGVEEIYVAGIQFAMNTLVLNNPDAGTATAGSRVGLQGNFDFGQQDLIGLNLSVSGTNYVYADGTTVTLDGVDATYTKSFTTAGVEFKSNLDVGYTDTDDTFSFTGKVTFSTNTGMKDVAADGSLVVKKGKISSFSVGLKGTFQIFALSVMPDNLTFEYDVNQTQPTFELYGKLAVSVSKTTITADMGTMTSPGLVVDRNGTIESVNMGLSGNFTLFGLGIQIPNDNPVTLDYQNTGNEYLISGEIIVPDFFSATTILGTPSQQGLQITDGEFKVESFELKLSDVDLGAFTIKQFDIMYSAGDSTSDPTYGVTLALKFPQDWEVAGSITIVDNKVHEIFVEYQADSPETQIAIGDTGLFLTEMDATVLNLDNLDEIVVSGHMAAVFGKQVAIFGEKVSMFRADGSFSVDRNQLSLDADVWLGASTNGGKTTGVLGSGNGQLLLDWHDGIYSMTMHASIVDGTYTFDATVEFNDNLQLWISAHASVNVPHSIPLIGGDHLGSMDFRLAFDPNDADNSYVAAWTRVNLVFTKPTIGVEYLFGKKEAKVIGSHDVKKINGPPPDGPIEKTVTYSANFTAPAGTTSASFSVDFPSNSGTQTISVTPPGGTTTQVDSSTPSSTGFALIDDLNSPTSINVSMIDPDNNLLPTGQYTITMASTNYEFPTPSATILLITNDGNNNTQIVLDGQDADQVQGVHVGNKITVAGNDLVGYNTEHVVTSVSPDGLTIVTDQLYSQDAQHGTLTGWQQPDFSATFLSTPPTVVVDTFNSNSATTIDDVFILDTPILEVELEGTVDSAFADSTTTTVNLFLDTDRSGYDGVLLQSKVPMTFTSTASGPYQFASKTQLDVSDLSTGTYHLYAVVNDGTNTPVYSSYSSGFITHHFVEGTILNQNNQPQAGWTIYADLNNPGIPNVQDANEPVSQLSKSSGEYQFAEDAVPYATVSFTSDTNEATPKVYIVFPDPSHRILVGDQILITGSSVPSYNKTYRVTNIFVQEGQSYVKTDQNWLFVDSGIVQASLLSQTSPLPSIQSVRQDQTTGQIVAEFAAPHRLQVGDRFFVNASQESGYSRTIHQVTAVVNETEVWTNQTSTSVGAYLTGSTLAQSIPVNQAFNLGIGTSPEGYELDSVVCSNSTCIYDGKHAVPALINVKENSVIRGNVYTDLTHDGVRVAAKPSRQFDFGTQISPVAFGFTQVTSDTVYSPSLKYGWVNVSTNPVSDDDRGSDVDTTELTQDANYNPDIIFQTDLPNGIYDVTLYFGDKSTVHDQVGVYLQGAQVDTVTTDVGQFLTNTYSGIVVSEGALTLQLTDLGGSDANAWIDGMSIIRAEDPPLVGWPVKLIGDDGETTTLSGTDGSYQFRDLPTGDYTVQLVPQNGSAATYSFDGTKPSDDTVADVSGSGQANQQVGTLRNGASVGTAASFSIDPRPNASALNQILHVNGTNQFVEVLTNTHLEPGTGAFSFAGWINVDDPTKAQDIAGVNDQMNTNDGWALRISYNAQSASKLSLVLRENNSTSSLQVAAGPILQAHTWYHVAFSYDPSIVNQNGNVAFDAVKIYVNGELQTNTIQFVNDLPVNPDISTAQQINFNIGARGSSNGATSFFFGGFLDELSVWDSALSRLQIQALFDGETSPSYAPSSTDTYSLTIAQDFEIMDNMDFGVDEFLAVGGTIQGRNYNARNLLDPALNPLADWTVNLLNPNGTPVKDQFGIPMRAKSASDGSYIFPRVPTGSYLIEENVPAGWRQASPSDATIRFSAPKTSTFNSSPVSIVAADFDQDGHVDLAYGVTGTATDGVRIEWGQGNGLYDRSSSNSFDVSFTNFAKLAAVDFNGDGASDLAVFSSTGKVETLMNNGSRIRKTLFTSGNPGWQLPDNSPPVEVAVGDFDGDTLQDLVVTRSKSSQGIALFDFGTPTSPIQAGYLQVTSDMTYNPTRGYGWVSNPVLGSVRKSGGNPLDLTIDGIANPDIIFRTDLPNGIYGVTLYYGDADYTHDQVGVYLQGNQVDLVTTTKGSYSTRQYTNIVVSDGTLTLRLLNQGGSDPNGRIDGMRILQTPGITFLPGNFGAATSQYLNSSSLGGIAPGFLDDDAFLDLALNQGEKEKAVVAAFGNGTGLFPKLINIPDEGTIENLELGGPVSLSRCQRKRRARHSLSRWKILCLRILPG